MYIATCTVYTRYEHEAIRLPKTENNIGAPSAPQIIRGSGLYRQGTLVMQLFHAPPPSLNSPLNYLKLVCACKVNEASQVHIYDYITLLRVTTV